LDFVYGHGVASRYRILRVRSRYFFH
jgi:hypothetical protein